MHRNIRVGHVEYFTSIFIFFFSRTRQRFAIIVESREAIRRGYCAAGEKGKRRNLGKNKNKTRLKAEALYSAHRRHQNIYTAQTLFFRMTSRCDMRAAFIAAETGGRLDLCIISRLVLHFLSANTDTARAYRRRLILLSPF